MIHALAPRTAPFDAGRPPRRLRQRVVHFAAAAALCVAAAGAPAQRADYVREQRWADEVVPQLVVGDAVRIEALGRSFLGLHTVGAGAAPQVAARPALLLLHGVGVHPDHGVTGALRARLADAGYTTLAIQMPVLGSEVTDGNDYVRTFDESTARIDAAQAWLRSRGAREVVLVSHSMGSWMGNVYFERTPSAPFAAWVCMGITGRIGAMADNRLPILDVRGEQDLPIVTRWYTVLARRATLAMHPGSVQREIAGANHSYVGRERELTDAIVEFVANLPSAR
jgi:alpha/beta superfamily hydrolase